MRLQGDTPGTPPAAGATPAAAGGHKRRPRDIGTAAETAVVRYLVANGWPSAERRALKGNLDQGDVTGCPGLVIEVKGGNAAKTASDGQITAWLAETETERLNAKADIGVLVLQRAGCGPANVGRWWAVIHLHHLNAFAHDAPVRMHLADACRYLRDIGYGTPLGDVA